MGATIVLPSFGGIGIVFGVALGSCAGAAASCLLRAGFEIFLVGFFRAFFWATGFVAGAIGCARIAIAGIFVGMD